MTKADISVLPSREFKSDHVCAISGGESRNVMAVTESPSPVLASNALEKREPEHIIFREVAMIKKAAGKDDMSKRILVVDDQPDNRQIIRDMLAPTDYEITEAENGELALAAIAKQRPDLILMDIQLPIMDGYTATSRIKSDPKLRSIPIIAVTSYALSGEERKARAAGCDDCVPKPFSPRQLLPKIRHYLQ
jgi:two-component system, cell cycle response regulator DivK